MLQLADILGVSVAEAVGMLVILWGWCDEHLVTGNVRGVTFVHVDDIVRRKGFANALAKVGWLRETKDGIDIPRFDRFLSKSAKNRLQGLERARKARRRAGKKTRTKRDENNAPNVTAALPQTQTQTQTQLQVGVKKNSPPKKTTRAAEAETIYQAYPKHVSKGPAIKAITKALEKVTFDELLVATGQYAKAVGACKGTKEWRFIPHPASWFNAERWNDEPEQGRDRPEAQDYDDEF